MIVPLHNIPKEHAEKLVAEFIQLKRKYFFGEWDTGQLKGGRLAEVVIRIFQHLLSEPVTPYGEDIKAQEKTRILNKTANDGSVDEHIRQKVVSITRLLLDFRNNRDVAHLGGFNANHPDALFVLSGATWILCEMVRVYGGVDMAEAQKIVESLSIKELPVIFEYQGELFITRNDLSSEEEVLVLLYKLEKSESNFLFEKTKDKNKSRFNEKLKVMEKKKLIAKHDGGYILLPLGKKCVEEKELLLFVS